MFSLWIKVFPFVTKQLLLICSDRLYNSHFPSMFAIFFQSKRRKNYRLILLSSLSDGISLPIPLMWVNWHVANTLLTDGWVIAIAQLLNFATQVLGLALLACQQYTDLGSPHTVVKRSRGRAHTHSAGTHPFLHWGPQLSQTHCFHYLLVPESLSDSWPKSETCKETIFV